MVAVACVVLSEEGVTMTVGDTERGSEVMKEDVEGAGEVWARETMNPDLVEGA